MRKKDTNFYTHFFNTQIFEVLLQSFAKKTNTLFENLIKEFNEQQQQQLHSSISSRSSKKDKKPFIFIPYIEKALYEMTTIEKHFSFPTFQINLKGNNFSKPIVSQIFDFSSIKLPEQFDFYYFSNSQLLNKVLSPKNSTVTQNAKFFDSRYKINRAQMRKAEGNKKVNKEDLEEEMKDCIKCFLLKIFSSEDLDDGEINSVKEVIAEDFGLTFFIKTIYDAILVNDSIEKYVSEDSLKQLNDIYVYTIGLISKNPPNQSTIYKLSRLYKTAIKIVDRKQKTTLLDEVFKAKGGRQDIINQPAFWEQWINPEILKSGFQKTKIEEEKGKLMTQILIDLIPTLKIFKLNKTVSRQILEEIGKKNIKVEGIMSSFRSQYEGMI